MADYVNTSLPGLLPEIILLCAAAVVLLLGLARRDVLRRLAQWAAVIGVGAAFVAALSNNVERHTTALGTFMTLLTCGIGILLLFSAWEMPFAMDPAHTDRHYRGEFFAMLLCSLAGVSMMAKVNNLIWLFLALELVSIPTYIVVATGRGQSEAQEAGIKYFFLGALSAAIYLFGFSYLYGFSGSTRFSVITAAFQAGISQHQVPWMAIIGVLLVLLGISYKIAAVPLHFYAADVYQGAATPVTAFLSFAPKAAGFVAIILLLGLTGWHFAGEPDSTIPALLTVMAVLTMTIGNVLALLQRNIKRMFAFSSIAHSGYILAALVAGPALVAGGGWAHDGVAAALFYLAAYSLMTVGAFAALIYMQGKADGAEDIDDIAGISSEHPLTAACMAICLLSLIGMPGTIGFLGKLFIVQADLSTGHWILAVFVVVNAAIAAAYYLRIIAAMYVREPWTPSQVRTTLAPRFAAALCAALVIGFGLAPSRLLSDVGHAADFMVGNSDAVHLTVRDRAKEPAGKCEIIFSRPLSKKYADGSAVRSLPPSPALGRNPALVALRMP